MPTSTRATSEPGGAARGFTLIELALVLLIVGIFLTLAAPRLTEIGEARLDAAARRIATMISYLHDEASLRGRVYRLSLDLDREAYTVDVHAPYAEGQIAEDFVADWDPYAEPSTLPDGVALDSVETASAVRSTGVAEVFFLPEDALGGVIITLSDGHGAALALEVDGVSGSVTIERVASRL